MVSQPLGLSVQFVAPRCSKLELNNSTKKPDAKVRLQLGFFVDYLRSFLKLLYQSSRRVLTKSFEPKPRERPRARASMVTKPMKTVSIRFFAIPSWEMEARTVKTTTR